MRNAVKRTVITVLLLCSAIAFACFSACSVGNQSGNSSDTPKHTHTYVETVSNKYLKSAATCTQKAVYYKSCSCGEKGSTTFEYGTALGHSYTNYESDNNATCVNNATETATCDRGCGTTDTRMVENTALGHDFTEWTSNENGTHTRTCNNANCSYYETKDCHGGAATCTKKAICSDCGEEYGTVLPHNYASEWTKTKTHHYHECACGAKADEAEHTPSAEPTETTAQTCTVCGYVIQPELGHVHTLHLTKIDANAATCTEAGNIEYYTCSCEKWFSDSTALTEITDKNSVVLTVLGHDYGEWIEEDPTVCGENGVKGHYHCSRCEKNFDSSRGEIADLTIYATEKHDYIDWITVKSGGCSAVSYKTRICKKCAHYELESDADVDLVHPHKFKLIANEATCTEDGIAYKFECENCSFVAAEKTIEKLGHDLPQYDYHVAKDTHYRICNRCQEEIHEYHTCLSWTTVKKSTCYEKGKQTGICEVCGGDMEKELPIVHDFKFTKYTTAPTCTENGESLYTCTICSATEKRTAYKLGHNHKYSSTITAATCTEKGLDLYVCSRCDNEKQVVTSALGHSWDSGTETITPDCYKTGNMHYVCTRDDCEAYYDETLPKKHAFDKGVITVTPTCTVNGKIKFTCGVCNHEEVVDLGVKHNTTYTAYKAAKCLTDGNYEYWHCEDCNKYFSKVTSEYAKVYYDGRTYYSETYAYTYKESTLSALTISKTGHDFSKTFNGYDSDNHWQKCLNGCGATQNTAPHQLEDSYVAENERVSGGYKHVIYHRWSCLYCDYYINGEKQSDGSISSDDGTEILHEHATYEPIEPIAATCTSVGFTGGMACGVCGETLLAPQQISALGHNFVDAVCTRCGLNSKYGTQGLKYTLNSDGKSYACSGMGTADTSFIVIASEYNGLPVTSISYAAFVNEFNLMSVVIPESITSIGSNAFNSCYKLVEVYNLSSINIVVGNSGNGYVGYYALDVYTDINSPSKLVKLNSGYVFYIGEETNYLIGYTGKDTSIVLPNIFAGKGYEIYKYAFYNKDITSVTIGYKVMNIGKSAFAGCSSLTEIKYNATECADLSSYNIYVFYNAGKNGTGIKVTIGKNVNKIPAYLFCEASYIIEVVFEEGSVCESIGDYAFRYCRLLTCIEIPNNVTSIEDWTVFSGCYSLENIYYNGDINDWVRIEGLYDLMDEGKSSKNLYINGELLTEANITTATEINGYVFYGCSSLTSVTIGNSVTRISSSAFEDCSSLQYNEYDNAYYLGNKINKYLWLIKKKSTDITSCTINENCKFIASSAFEDCSSLTSITIPNSVTNIGGGAFNDCYRLVEVINKSILDITTSSWNNGYWRDYYLLNVKTEGESDIVNKDGYLFYTYDSVNYLLGYVGNETSLTLPEKYNGQNYKIHNYAFYDCSSLTSITIPNSVTSIGSFAFEDCSLLNKVKYNGTIDQWVQISFSGYYSNPLYYAKNLYINGKLVTEANITTATKINDYAFNDCSSLTSITIPDSVTNIGENAFGDCKSLTSVTIGDSVTSIGYAAFYGCSSLTSVTLPNSVTSIGSDAFSGCYKLVEVINKSKLTINKGSNGNGYVGYYALNVKTEGESDIINKDGYLFYTYDNVNYLLGYVGNKTSLTLPENYNGQNYEIYEYAFYKCSSLTNITVPNSVTSIGDDSFRDCSSLTSVTIGNGVTSLPNGIFNGCGSLEEITIPFVGAKVGVTSDDTYQLPFGHIFGQSSYTGGTKTEQLYYGSSTSSNNFICYYIPSNLKKVTVTGGNILHGAFSWCRSLTSVTLLNSVTSIGSNAFEYCSSLVNVTIPESVTSIGGAAFYDCSSLVNVTIPESVTSIGGAAFYYCKSLTSITIPNSVTSIGDYAFEGCCLLTSIKIPEGVTSIGNYAFEYCYKLVEVINKSNLTITKGSSDNGYVGRYALTIHNENSKIENIGNCQFITGDDGINYLVNYVGNETEIILPENYNGQNYVINAYAFYYCKSLTSITIPNSVTSIGDSAFSGCSSLKSVTIGNGVTSIGSDAFEYCSSLKSVTIGNGVTSIGSFAFYNCTMLTNIEIPDSVKYIENYAFSGCSSLTTIYCKANGKLSNWDKNWNTYCNAEVVWGYTG